MSLRVIEKAFKEAKARRDLSDREAFKLGLGDKKSKKKSKTTIEQKKEALQEALEVVKLVIVNQYGKRKDEYCKIARLYFHDETKNHALLMADDIKMYELKSAKVLDL